MSELKNCPFCGTSDVGVGFVMPQFSEEVKHFVVCNQCGSRTANFRAVQNAIVIWNARADDE